MVDVQLPTTVLLKHGITNQNFIFNNQLKNQWLIVIELQV